MKWGWTPLTRRWGWLAVAHVRCCVYLEIEGSICTYLYTKSSKVVVEVFVIIIIIFG